MSWKKHPLYIKFDAATSASLHPLMLAHGFGGSSNAGYYRRMGELVWLVYPSYSRFAGDEIASVDVGYGVAVPEIVEFLRGNPQYSTLRPKRSILYGGNAGSLAQVRSADREFSRATRVDELGDRIARLYLDHGNPVLSQLLTVDGVMERWRGMDFSDPYRSAGDERYLAAAHWIRGERADALAAIEERRGFIRRSKNLVSPIVTVELEELVRFERWLREQPLGARHGSC